MGPEILSAVSGRPRGVANLGASVADVLGTSIFIIFIMMLAVTPVQTMTGWRWHVVLRRDYGVAMFVVAATDLTIAAITTGDTFPGGFLSRVGGHTFLFAGTLSTLLALPLAATANLRARRWLGRYWKWLHRLTYVVWVTILVHLLLLFGFRTLFLDAVAVSVPLGALRLPPVRRWWELSRRAKTHGLTRWVAAVALVSVFIAGYAPFVRELARKGGPAFAQHAAHD
jgi:sulfoxide reductase heme-binding subunit YedZ